MAISLRLATINLRMGGAIWAFGKFASGSAELIVYRAERTPNRPGQSNDGIEGETPKTKHRTPKKHQTPTFKGKTAAAIWGLRLGALLEFGVWDLVLIFGAMFKTQDLHVR